ncbi:MAG: hypothetical protein SGARI_001156 [Bacillariaceae sp.]
MIKQSASFSDYEKYRDPSRRDDSMEYSFRTQEHHEFDANWIHPMNKNVHAVNSMVDHEDDADYEDEPSFISTKASPRVLWNETSGLQTQMEALALGHQQMITAISRTPKRLEERDEIMDGLVYDSDEIMTPIKDRKVIVVPSINITAGKTNTNNLISPDASAMITPLMEAVTFETPEKLSLPVVGPATAVMQNSMVENDSGAHEITPTNSADEVVLSPPNAPKKERLQKTPTANNDEMKMAPGSSTPATVGTAETATSSPDSYVIPMNEEMLPMSAVKLSVNPTSGVIQWQSLYRNEKGEFSVTKSPEENPTKVASLNEVTLIIQAISDQNIESENDNAHPCNNNMLKLFTHLYAQSTYDEILKNVPQVKDQSTLVISRGLDFSASTYHTAAEGKNLLEALKNVDKMDSIMLLNFRPESMVDLAKTLNQHPSMYRLNLHLAEGALNGELLGVIATAPRLAHLQMDLKESCAIGTLMNSKSLQTLRVTSGDITLDKAHLRTLIYGIGSNSVLTTLDLAPEMSIEHFREQET